MGLNIEAAPEIPVLVGHFDPAQRFFAGAAHVVAILYHCILLVEDAAQSWRSLILHLLVRCKVRSSL